MTKPDLIIVDGHAFSWRRLIAIRQEQLKTWRAQHGEQSVLFDVKIDARPVSERTAAGRYREPTLLELMRQV